LQSRATKPKAAPDLDAVRSVVDDMRKAETDDSDHHFSPLRTGLAVGGAFAGGLMLGGARSNAIVSDLAATSHDAMPEQKAQAEGVLRETLNSVWDEFESVMKDISHDVAKELAKTGLSLFVLNYIIAPLLQRLRPHRNNPIVAETARRLQTIADKLEADHHAQLDERNVAIWTGVSPAEAQLLLRA
jgi:hypothetical protein